MKKILILTFLFIFFLFPFSPLKASGGDFSFRSTVMGDNIRNTNAYVYEIVNQKYNFSSTDNVYALSRIFNIGNIESFQLKQLIYSSNNNNYKTLYSPVYRPRGQWWAETYSWVNFGKLSNGNYNLKSYIRINGGNYRELSQKNFNVGNSYSNSYNNNSCAYDSYYCNNNNYNHNGNYNYRTSPSYSYNWLKTGLGVSSSYNNTKAINNEKSDFHASDNIYTLLRLSNIRDVYSFKIKQVVYNSNNKITRISESGLYNPNNSYWTKSYIENKIGRLSFGNYRIKTYIKINNNSYKYLGEKSIRINNYSYNNNQNYSPNYNYSWTQSDNRLRHNSGYIYSLDNPKTSFLTNENVVVLTKLSNIRNVNSLQIKHEFFKDGRNRYKTLESPERRPGGADWQYNYNYADFGTMPVGNHKIKVFIRINSGSWKQIDTVSVSIKQYGYISNNYNYNQSSNYTYNWTKMGDQVSATQNPGSYYSYNSY